jgi:pantoate--beta-alanine ligase
MIRIAKTVASARGLCQDLSSRGGKVALVPTMGALHDGHLSLVQEARKYAEHVVVSIYVNPTQFAANEDLGAYPRDLEGDLAKLGTVNVDGVFLPDNSVMYPEGFASAISMAGPALGLEADFRPTHFAGVALVVAKLLLITGVDVAVFGEKDFQQLQVIRRLVSDLNIACSIYGAPTLRGVGGLALSSRNAYLSPEELKIAPELNKGLRLCAKALCEGKSPSEAESIGLAHIKSHGFVPDYLSVRDANNLQPVTDAKTQALRILTAAKLGRTRLIDNIGFEANAC